MLFGNSKNLILDDSSTIAPDNTFIDVSKARVIIGKNTHILRDVRIYTHDHQWDYIDWHEREPKCHDLRIGDNVIIMMGAIILYKCHSIGNNSIIGAMSLVTKDIPSNEVWVGVPARKLRDRMVI